ncbi:N-acetyltransferase [Microbulbifer sp. TYP-18]|uniref:N-acetyltransferase n=1 Tax=Microbulbifer sp. TYP-18 TaxID=3230024 RepID=UPI0034C62C93
MGNLNYLRFTEINPDEFLPILNSEKIRKHLIEHDLFTIDTLKVWMEAKLEVDGQSGCRVRAIVFEGLLVGWCGIQLEGGKYELAIIIDDQFWGLGKQVFRDLMLWAREFGHKEVSMNLLNTRRDYRFLNKISKRVRDAELYGQQFTEYLLEIK